jgi:hypothetical protein
MDLPGPAPVTRSAETFASAPPLERVGPSSHPPGRRRILWLAGLAAAASVASGYMLLGGRASDAMLPGDRQALSAAAATAVLAPPRVDLDDPRQVERAMATMQLAPEQTAQVMADARGRRIELAWIVLRDFLDEDGDAVEVTTGGFTRTVLLTNAPQTIAVPIVPGDFLRLKGARDGAGGGVTVSVVAGGAEIRLPPLEVGQTVTLPLR